MNKAHVFQHQFTGLQIFVYHQPNEVQAKTMLTMIVRCPVDWIYLGQKTAQDAK